MCLGLREPAETGLLDRPTGQGMGEWVHPLRVMGEPSSHPCVSSDILFVSSEVGRA